MIRSEYTSKSRKHDTQASYSSKAIAPIPENGLCSALLILYGVAFLAGAGVAGRGAGAGVEAAGDPPFTGYA